MFRFFIWIPCIRALLRPCTTGLFRVHRELRFFFFRLDFPLLKAPNIKEKSTAKRGFWKRWCLGMTVVCRWQYFSLALRKQAFDGLRSNVHPYSSRCDERVQLLRRISAKAKGVHRTPLFSFCERAVKRCVIVGKNSKKYTKCATR